MSTSRTVLVVDDEAQILRLITRVLERQGSRVLGAASGEEARRLFREHAAEIEIVLVDVTMPAGGGAEALLPEFLAKRPELEVIVMSGHSLPETLEVLLGRIGGRFLHKPFVPKALLRMLEASESNRPDPIGSSNFVGPGHS